MRIYRHLGFPSFKNGLWYRVPEERGSRGSLQWGEQRLRGHDWEVYGTHDPLMVQEGSLDRDSVLHLAQSVSGVPYSEMVYTGLRARLLAWSECGERGPHPCREMCKMIRGCGRVWGSCARAAHVLECASTVWGRWHEIMAALVPLKRVSSTAHVVVMGQLGGRVRGATDGVQEVYFL